MSIRQHALITGATLLLLCRPGEVLLGTNGFCADGGLGEAPAPPTQTVERHWKPVEDSVYLQEIGMQIPTDKPVTALAVLGSDVFVVTGDSMERLLNDKLQEV